MKENKNMETQKVVFTNKDLGLRLAGSVDFLCSLSYVDSESIAPFFARTL